MAGFVIVAVVLAASAVLAFGVPRSLRRAFTTTVYESDHGLLYVDGRYRGSVPAGRHWTGGWRERRIVTLPRNPRTEAVAHVDVTSADGFSFRLSATLVYAVADPRAAHEGGHREHLRLVVTDALVRLAAGRTLDALLAERAGLAEAARALIAPTICGCRAESLLVTAVSLPPETRRLVSQVERARREAQAALERARGEQAALRSLANAARMLKGNRELMHLRLLQAVSGTEGRGGATLVLGREVFAPDGSDGRAAPEEGGPA